MASLPTVALLLGPEPVAPIPALSYSFPAPIPISLFFCPRTVAAAVAELGHVLPGDLVAIQAAAGARGPRAGPASTESDSHEEV